MNAVYHFIVSVPKKFEDTLKLGDKEIFWKINLTSLSIGYPTEKLYLHR